MKIDKDKVKKGGEFLTVAGPIVGAIGKIIVESLSKSKTNN